MREHGEPVGRGRSLSNPLKINVRMPREERSQLGLSHQTDREPGKGRAPGPELPEVPQGASPERPSCLPHPATGMAERDRGSRASPSPALCYDVRI